MELQILSLFSFSKLLIWVPGLLFLVATVLSLRAYERGEDPARLHQVMLGLFIVSLIIGIVIPRIEINKALEFARAYDPETEINGIEDMSYSTKDAYFRMSGEQPAAGSSGDEMFDFSESAGDAQAPADAPAQEAPATETIIYEPETGVAWFLLMVFLIMGAILFVQGPRVLGQNKATPSTL